MKRRRLQARSSPLVLLAAWAALSCHTSQTRSSGPEALPVANSSVALATTAPTVGAPACDRECPLRSFEERSLGWSNFDAPLLDAAHAYLNVDGLVQVDRGSFKVERNMAAPVAAMVDAGDAIITCRNDWQDHESWEQAVIERVPKAEGQATLLARTRDCRMTRAGQYLYFVHSSFRGDELARMPLVGGPSETLAPLSSEYGCSNRFKRVLVGHGEDVYWLAHEKVVRWRHETYEEVAAAPHALGLAVVEDKLYYADHTRIWSLDKLGHAQVVVNFRRVEELTSDGRFLYWIEGAVDQDQGSARLNRLMRFDPSTGAVARLFDKEDVTALRASQLGVTWTTRNPQETKKLYVLDECDCHRWSSDVAALRDAVGPSSFEDSFYVGSREGDTAVFVPNDLSADEQDQLVELGMAYEHDVPRNEPNLPERFRPGRLLASSTVGERLEVPILAVELDRSRGCEDVTLVVRVGSPIADDSPVIAPLKAPPIVKPRPLPNDPELVKLYTAGALPLARAATGVLQGPLDGRVQVRFGHFPQPYVALISAVYWSGGEAYSFLCLGDAKGGVSQFDRTTGFTGIKFEVSLVRGTAGVEEVILEQGHSEGRVQSVLGWVNGAPVLRVRERVDINAE